jgi:hypothetical protein
MYCYAAIATGTTICPDCCISIPTVTAARRAATYDSTTVTCVAAIAGACPSYCTSIPTVTAARRAATYDSTTVTCVAAFEDN